MSKPIVDLPLAPRRGQGPDVLIEHQRGDRRQVATVRTLFVQCHPRQLEQLVQAVERRFFIACTTMERLRRDARPQLGVERPGRPAIGLGRLPSPFTERL